MPGSHAGQEPCARRTILAAFRAAALRLWGPERLAELADSMPDDCRREAIEPVVLAREWYPERYVLAWYDAAWNGPCGRDKDAFCQLLDRMMDQGFGRVRKALIGLASPKLVVAKAPELWRHDHTHGTLSVEHLAHGATATLVDHPYTESPLARLAIAEIYRYAVSLSWARTVTQTHHLVDGGALRVRVAWE